LETSFYNFFNIMRFKTSIILSVFVLLVGFSAGCSKDKNDGNLKVPRLMAEIRGVNYGALTGETVTLPLSGTTIQLQKDPVVNEFDFLDVNLVKVDLGLALVFQLTEKGARKLYRASVTNTGSRFVLNVNGNAIAARRIDGAIPDGQYYTFVEVADDELEQLILDLKASFVELQKNK